MGVGSIFFVLRHVGRNTRPRQGMGEGGSGILRAESRHVPGLTNILKCIAEINLQEAPGVERNA